MNELKPEDVMRALELCKSCRDLLPCDGCPYFRAELGDDESCTNRMAQDALALLREKDAEIERLNIDLQAMRGAANSYKMHIVEQEKELTERKMMAEMHRFTVEEIRVEAITEFAERLYPLYKVLCVDEGDWQNEVDKIAKDLKEAPQ